MIVVFFLWPEKRGELTKPRLLNQICFAQNGTKISFRKQQKKLPLEAFCSLADSKQSCYSGEKVTAAEER